MKLHLPHSLRTALLCAFSLVSTLGTSNTYAAGLHSQVGMVTYTDFGQNMGRYRVNGVNDLLSTIRENDGVCIYYQEGHEDFRLPHYMISYESQGDNGAYAAVGYNFIATVAHNGCQNPTFTGRYINGADSLHYYGVEYRSNITFCLQPGDVVFSSNWAYDFKMTRLNKLITDVTTSDLVPRFPENYDYSQLHGIMEYRAGSGTMTMRHLDRRIEGLTGAYAYVTGAVQTITTGGTTNQQWGCFTAGGNLNPTAAGINDSAPLPFVGAAGDSGSPVWIWDDESKSYLYLAAYQSGSDWFGQARGSINFAWDSLTKFDKLVDMEQGASRTVHIKGVTATEQDESVTDGTRTTLLHLGRVEDGNGNLITNYVGVKGDDDRYIHTWLNLAEIKDQASWFATNNKYYNVGSYKEGNVTTQRELDIEDLFNDSNLVFRASSETGNSVVVDEDTDLGIGYLQFSINPESGINHAVFTLQSNEKNSDGRDFMVNSAGFVVEKGVDLHVTLTNTQWDSDADDYYYREWRKVGDGDLYLEGQGDNHIFLNVGGKGTTYLAEKGGYAAYNVYAGSGTTVVMDDTSQIARDFTFGYNGGTLDIRGNNSMDWYRTNPNVAAQGFSINSFSEDSYITNSLAGTTLNLTYREGGETEYLGSFVDTEGGGAVRIVFDAGFEANTILRSIHTNLQNEDSGITVKSGMLTLVGSNTVHAMGSATGRNTARYFSDEDWHYADMATDVMVEGGMFVLGSHARLKGDVTLASTGSLIIHEGVRNAYEYIEGGIRKEDTTTDFYRQFYGLKGDIKTVEGSSVYFAFDAATTAEQVYDGNITGGGDILVSLGGGGATLHLSGESDISGLKELMGGGLVSEKGLASLGSAVDNDHAWYVADDAYIAAKEATGDELLGMVMKTSRGTLALTQAQETDLLLQDNGYTNLIVGALEGLEVHYGTDGAALATVSNDDKDQWLLGGGGGNLIVDFALKNHEAELVLGNEYTTGTVTLTNAANSIGAITFMGQVTLEYTSEEALGGANVSLNYTNRLKLLSEGGLERVTGDSNGVVLVDKTPEAVYNLSSHRDLYLGASQDTVLHTAPTVAAGSAYRFGGIEGVLTLEPPLQDSGDQATALIVDGQTFSGGVLELAQAAGITGAVEVRGYDAGQLPLGVQPHGDITLRLTKDDSLIHASGVTLKDGGILDIYGTSQTVHNLNTEDGSLVTSSTGGGVLTVAGNADSQIAGVLDLYRVNKQGTGTMVLSGTSLVDVFDVQQGTLRVTAAEALSGLVTVHGNGSLVLPGGTVDAILSLEDGAHVSVTSNATATLGGMELADGATATLQGGTLALPRQATIGSTGTTLELTGNANLTLSADENMTIHSMLQATGNTTSKVSVSGGSADAHYTRVFDGIIVDQGSTLTLEQTVQETAPIYEIRNLSGQGTLVLSGGSYKDAPSFYKLTRDTEFTGTFKILAGTGYSSHPYMSHTLIQSDNALAGAQVQMQGWSSDSGFITLGIDTENASIKGLSTVSNNRSILMAGATTADTAQDAPVSSRRATLTITGSANNTFQGRVVGGASGTNHGLSIVMNGSSTQTFNGSTVVFNNVSALAGKLVLNSEGLAINEDVTVARGAQLEITHGWTLDEGHTLHVEGDASAASAALNNALTLYGGTIDFSGTALNSATEALHVSSLSGDRVSVTLSGTAALQPGTYLLANGDWSNIAVNGTASHPYYELAFTQGATGLSVTVTQDTNSYIWNGSADSHEWNASEFGQHDVAFDSTLTAVFSDAAQERQVNITEDVTAGELVFDSSNNYTLGGAHRVSASSLIQMGSGTADLGGRATIRGEANLTNGTLVMHSGDTADSVSIGEKAMLRLVESGANPGTISGLGTLAVALEDGASVDIPAIGADGLGRLVVVSGTAVAGDTLHVTESVWVNEPGTLTVSPTALSADVASKLHLEGTLKINSTGNYTLGTSLGTSGESVGRLVITGGGTATVEDAVALNLAEISIEGGSMLMKRNGSSERNIGTLSLSEGREFTLHGSTQPTEALEFAALKLAGSTATVSNQNNSEAMVFRSLSGSAEPATLNLVKRASSTKMTIFEFGGAEPCSTEFTGTINLSSEVGGSRRSAAVVLSNANVAAHAVVNLASANSGDAILGLGVNADTVNIAGLSSNSDLGNRARVFSGAVEVNADSSDSVFNGDGVDRKLVITTAQDKEYTYYGSFASNVGITVAGEGIQRFAGEDLSADLRVADGTASIGAARVSGHVTVDNGAQLLFTGERTVLSSMIAVNGALSFTAANAVLELDDTGDLDFSQIHYVDINGEKSENGNGFVQSGQVKVFEFGEGCTPLDRSRFSIVYEDNVLQLDESGVARFGQESAHTYAVRNGKVTYDADFAQKAAAQEMESFVLSSAQAESPAVLEIEKDLEGGIVIHSSGLGGTVNLAQGATLHQGKLVDNQSVKIGGAGTYQIALRQSTSNIDTHLGVQGHVTLADDWTGTVEVLGEGGDHSHIRLQDYGNSHSTVKLTGNSGWLDAGSFDTNLLLEDAGSRSALIISNGSQNSTETFNGSISGSGTLEKVWSRNLNFKFNGDLSQWTGGFKTTGGAANVYLLAGVTDVGASIQANSLTVGASATDTADVTFHNTVRVASLTAHGSVTVGDKGMLDLTALTSAATLDSLTLADGSTLALNQTGWLTTTGTLAVEDGATLDLTRLSVSGNPQSYVLATGGNVTLGNNVSFTLADESLMARASLSVADDTSLVLTVARGVSDLLWQGADGTWTTDASTMNWYFDGTSNETAFVRGDNVRFGTGSNNRTATLAEDINAGAVTVNENAAVTVALNDHGLTTGNLAVESGSTLTITGSGRTLETAASNIGGAVSLASATTLKLNGAESSFSLGKVTLNNGSKLDVAAAASVTAESLFVADASDAEISLAQDMTITAGGSADDKAGALYTMGATKTLNIHSADAADIKTLTVDKLDIANSNTGVSLQDVVMNVREAATVGVLITDRTHDVGHMTVGGGAELNFNGSVNWHNSENVVSLTVQRGGAVNVNHGAANSLNDITVNEGGSLSFSADTTTALFGSVTLAEQIANDGTLDFGGRAVAISLADDTATFHFKDAGYTNIDGDEDENGFSHSMMGAVTSGSGNIANGGSVAVTFGGSSFSGLNADGTFGSIDNATYHVRNGEVEYSTLKGSSTITSVALSDNATLNLDAALATNVGITSTGTGGTVEIGGGTTLQAAKLHADAATKLAGEGRYAISCASAPTLGANVSLGDDWNGILSFSGGASNINIQLNTLTEHATPEGTAYSTVEFDGASGYFQGGGPNTFASDIILAADHDNRSAMNVSNGNGGAVYTFSGKVSGSGSFERSATGPADLSFTFTGDVADWTGKFKLTNAKNNTAVTTLNFTGNTPSREDDRVLIAAGVVNAANGKTLNVTVTNGKEVVLTGDFTRTAGTLNLTVDANAAFTGTLSDVSSLTIKSGASVQLLATGETPVQHSVGTIAFDGGNAYNRNLLVAEGVKLTAANINNAWGVGTMRVEGEMDVTTLLKFSSGGNGSTLNNIITGNGTINAAALEFSNVGTYNITDLHALNVSGATTFNTSNTVNVSASTLNLNGTVTSSRGSLNLHDGAVVNINGISGTNTLLNLTASAFSNLAFAQGTTNSISGSGSLAATIANEGDLTLNGTYSLDGFDISQAGTFTGGQQSGNGFLTGDLSIQLVSGGGTVQEGDALVLTYFGKAGTLDTETGRVAFAGAGQPQYDTFYVNKTGTSESLANAILKSSGTMESVRLANGTSLAMDSDGATLQHLVLEEHASATLNVTQSGTINSVEGLEAGRTLTVSGISGKVLSTSRLEGNAGSAVVVAENATLALTSTDRKNYYTHVSDLDVQGTISLKGNNGDIRFDGYEDGQVFNMGHLDIDGASGTTYVLTSGGVNYATDIVVKSLSGGGANHTLQVSDCYNGGSVGMVIDFIIGETQDHAALYTGKIQYGIGTSSAKAGSGMNVVLKDELVASQAVLDAIFSGAAAQSATITVDTARAKVKGLTGTGNDARSMHVSGTDATGNRVLEIVGDGNYTYGGKLGAHLDVVHSGSGTQSFAGVDGFNGSIEVQAGIMEIMNAASVNVQDVTINNGTLGVYKDGTVAEANEGTITIKDTKTLTAGKNAKLNANLVMESGSTLDVSATGGAGLLMGSSVTLNPDVTLSGDDMAAITALGFMDQYTLFTGVDAFSYDGTTPTSTPIALDSETWVKASEVFSNPEFTGGKDYYVFYSGVQNGSNVGAVYVMLLPEPTTGTLSLLALAALAARRRRR